VFFCCFICVTLLWVLTLTQLIRFFTVIFHSHITWVEGRLLDWSDMIAELITLSTGSSGWLLVNWCWLVAIETSSAACSAQHDKTIHHSAMQSTYRKYTMLEQCYPQQHKGQLKRLKWSLIFNKCHIYLAIIECMLQNLFKTLAMGPVFPFIDSRMNM